MNVYFRTIAFLVVTLLLTPCYAAPVPSVSESQPFAILACRYAGDSNEPATIDQLNAIFGVADGTPGTVGTLDHYWREVSYGIIDMMGTRAFGWFELPYSLAEYDAAENGLFNSAIDCIAAAMAGDISFNPTEFVGLATIFNDYLPYPEVGGSKPALGYYGFMSLTLPGGVTGDWRLLQVSRNLVFRRKTYAHEIGHTFEMFHSKRPTGIDYGNPWDLMSSGSCPVDDDNCPDVHPIAYQKASVQWIPDTRKHTIDSYATSTVNLYAHHNLDVGSEPLLIEVPTGNSEEMYTIEARVSDPTSYDNLLPFSGVIVHRVEGSYATHPTIVLNGEMQMPPNEAFLGVPSSVFEVGETFNESIGPVGSLSFTVNAPLGDPSNPQGYSIAITLDPPPPFTGCAPGQQDQISQGECEALVALADMADSRPDDWLGLSTPCSWTGVVCANFDTDEQLEVIRLHMQHFQWDITFAEDDDVFLGLPELRTLDMANLNIDGTMPNSVYSLNHLVRLDAQGLTGPISPDIANLTQLQMLYFSYSRFQGTLPAEIGNLTDLTHIYINSMPNISGALPRQWTNLDNVEDLRFSGSDLCIPDDSAVVDWLNGIYQVYPGSNQWTYCESADVVLVLDDTFSMQQPTGDGSGNTKIQALENSIGLFSSLLGYFRTDMDERIGAFSFKMPPNTNLVQGCDESWSQQLVALDSLDSALPLVDTAVGNMQADGWATPLRAGIQSASDVLSASAADRRRLMLLLSDGKQNTVGCYIGSPHAEETLSAFKQELITDRDIKLLAVGFGSDGQIDDALLSDLATDGYYDSATSTLELNKWFIQALSLTLGQSMVLDPEGSLLPGEAESHTLSLTDHNKSVTFISTWSRSASDLQLSLRMPDGTDIQEENVSAGIKLLTGDTFQAFVLELPLTGDFKDKLVAGQWQATVRRESHGDQSEPYQLMVMADTPIQLDTEVNTETATTEDEIEVVADLSGTGNAIVYADIYQPIEGAGNRLSKLGLPPAEIFRLTANLPNDTNMLSRRIHLMKQKEIEWPIEREIRTIKLSEDRNKRFDRKDRHIFKNKFRPNKADGIYAVRFRVEGESTSGQKFQREFKRGFYIKPAISPKVSKVDIQRLSTSKDENLHSQSYRLLVTPQDSNGLLLGPGYAETIKLSPADMETSVQDRGDGSYSITFTTADDPNKQTITLSVMGQALRPIYLPAVKDTSRTPWVLAGVLFFLWIYSLLSRRPSVKPNKSA